MISTRTALEAHENLRWIVAQWPKLQAALERGGGNALSGMPRGQSANVPIDVRISDLMFEISQHTEFYAMILLEETADWRTATLHMPGLLEAVNERHGHFTADEDEKLAHDFCDWAHDTRNKVERALEKPAPRRFLGPCRADGCDGEIHAREGRTSGVCPECGEPWTMDEQRQWLATALDGLLLERWEIHDALKIAGFRVSRGTIRQWIHRGQIAKKHDTPDLYSFADAYAMARRLRPQKVA